MGQLRRRANGAIDFRYDQSRIRRNGFRFALAVGDKRHYVMSGILPRHFAQTTVGAGMHPRAVHDICAELADTAVPSIAAALESMPEDFPAELAESVTRGMRARMRLIEQFQA